MQACLTAAVSDLIHRKVIFDLCLDNIQLYVALLSSAILAVMCRFYLCMSIFWGVVATAAGDAVRTIA